MTDLGETSARLVPTRVPRDPKGIVVVLHGGASRASSSAVSPTQASVLRMVPIARRVSRAGRGRLAVYRLLNSRRGWDTTHTPVHDAVRAIRATRERLGELPVVLVGHSLGGRAALLAGTEAGVLGVVALNPWVYPSDDADLSGRRVLIVHGTLDRIALPDRSAAMARRLARRSEVRYVEVPGAKHAMLRHGRDFERLTADFVTDLLC